MPGLTDMEEMLEVVQDKDIADFLREALVCYGTGAYRACVVLTNIALFDDLRRKIKALAPVNTIARTVSDQIEPLVAGQKVFETPLIQKLKSAGIISTLEAQILEQLNNQRNKAAHPSQHVVTPEEARYVFSEAIQKFISQSIRQTSYIVDRIADRMADQNFFPSAGLGDMKLVVEQEITNLDKQAMPFLITKITESIDSSDPVKRQNGQKFLITISSKKDIDVRTAVIKHFVDPKSSNPNNAELFCSIICCDPKILNELAPGTKLRCESLILANANNVGIAGPYQELCNPIHVFCSCISELGEDFMLSNWKGFCDWIMGQCPISPEIISNLHSSPKLFGGLYEKYLERAASYTFDTANAMARAIPAVDRSLAAITSDEQAFRLVVAFVVSAQNNAFDSVALSNGKFCSIPQLRARAVSFASSDPSLASKIVQTMIQKTLPNVIQQYLS